MHAQNVSTKKKDYFSPELKQRLTPHCKAHQTVLYPKTPYKMNIFKAHPCSMMASY